MSFTSSDTILDKVVLAVEQTLYLERDTVCSTTRLFDDLSVGRLDRIRLALQLEETFDLEIPDHAIERFDTVSDIANYMSRWALGSAEFSAQPWLRA